jgi:hypothetical protein
MGQGVTWSGGMGREAGKVAGSRGANEDRLEI